jgi:hypothetical protein
MRHSWTLAHELRALLVSQQDAPAIFEAAGAFESVVDGMRPGMLAVVAEPLARERFSDAIRAAATYLFDVQLPGKTGVPSGTFRAS